MGDSKTHLFWPLPPPGPVPLGLPVPVPAPGHFRSSASFAHVAKPMSSTLNGRTDYHSVYRGFFDDGGETSLKPEAGPCHWRRRFVPTRQCRHQCRVTVVDAWPATARDQKTTHYLSRSKGLHPLSPVVHSQGVPLQPSLASQCLPHSLIALNVGCIYAPGETDVAMVVCNTLTPGKLIHTTGSE
jgi:hypothetical protein